MWTRCAPETLYDGSVGRPSLGGPDAGAGAAAPGTGTRAGGEAAEAGGALAAAAHPNRDRAVAEDPARDGGGGAGRIDHAAAGGRVRAPGCAFGLAPGGD